MQNVDFVLTAAVTLFFAQAALLIMRTPSCVRRVEPLMLAAFLLLLALWLVTPSWMNLHGPLLVLPLWAGGAFLLRVEGRSSLAWWTSASAGFLLALLLAGLLGYRDSVPYVAFRGFGMALLSALPLGILFRLWSASRSTPTMLTLISCSLWLVTGAADLVLGLPRTLAPLLEAPPVLLLSACTAWLVFEEGYPTRAGWNGGLGALEDRERLTRTVFARLMETESALARQDRLIASGILALGAAHEFKNILANIKATIQYGLEQRDAQRKDESLRLLLRHAEAGQYSTIGVLEHIAREGRENPRIIDVAVDLQGFLRMARAAFRSVGIVIEADLAPGVRFRGRNEEVEQVLLNLVRNAAEAYRRGRADGTWVVSIRARRVEDVAVLEVTDRAGGVPADVAHKLFSPWASGFGGTGLGLYLSRSLAAENEGSLEYQGTEDGSVFRLVFPSVEEDGGDPDAV
jgi:signal transduction histidine kinase